MIVKDEARSIEKTLASVRPFVDGWLIVDTGSTDGTPALIESSLSGIPGRIEYAPFVDYSTTRNLALSLAEPLGDWVLMLSGGESITDAAGLREFLSKTPADGISCRVTLGHRQFDSTRIHRSSAAWRYRGKTHEVLVSPAGYSSVEKAPCHILHEKFPGEWEKELARWRRDAELLLPDAQAGDHRSMFYLGASHDCLGQMDDAEAWYRKRAAAGGWHEEAWEARYRVAQIVARREFTEGLTLLLDCYEAAPHRAEPLCVIAQHHYDRGQYALSFGFASWGAGIPYPQQDRLFVDADVYAWKLHDLVSITAWRIGQQPRGEVASRRAAEGFYGLYGRHDDRLWKNVNWYAEKSCAL